MMRDTTWMDAEAALAYGFVDRVAQPNPASTVINCAVARDVAEKRVQLWVDRHRQLSNAYRKRDQTKTIIPKEDKSDEQPEQQLVQTGEAEETQTTEAANAASAPEAAAFEPANEPVDTGDPEAPEQHDEPESGVPIGQLRKRLALIMPSEAKNRR
jgi:hypothetical protein